MKKKKTEEAENKPEIKQPKEDKKRKAKDEAIDDDI